MPGVQKAYPDVCRVGFQVSGFWFQVSVNAKSFDAEIQKNARGGAHGSVLS
jgi:hypothetical protein